MSKFGEALKNKKGFVGFLTAGDPSLEKTEEFIVEIERAGASIIEIGIPFSDPVAEGPMVQDANVRALSAPGGCTTDMIFDMVGRVSAKVSVPLVFLTYLNPVYKYGYDNFFAKCKETGISGIIIPDMPYEEKEEVMQIADKYQVDVISLVVPGNDDRIKMIAKEAKGYVYALSTIGKDERDDSVIIAETQKLVDTIREVTDIPVVVDIGYNTANKAAECSKIADGIILENGIVKIIAERGKNAGKYVYDYVKSIVDVL